MLKTIAAVIILSSPLVQAKIPIRPAGIEKKNIYVEQGVFVGGFHQPDLNLLGIRFGIQQPLKSERLVIEVGSETPVEAARPGFFHASLQTSPRRLIVDLQEVRGNKVNLSELRKQISKSNFISEVRVFHDKRVPDMTLEFLLSKSVKFEVFELSSTGKPGRLVVDLQGL